MDNGLEQKKRWAIYLRDKFICLICNISLSNKPEQLTLDHIIPRSKQGSNHETNLVYFVVGIVIVAVKIKSLKIIRELRL